jgi:tRNA A-37 threonylcarbamoyl transferase component Bud32
VNGPTSLRAEEIFLALAEVSANERSAAVRERCGEDARLRAEVEALLETLDAPEDGFLDPTTIPTLDMNAVDGPLTPGTPLGPFLVLHAIGSGGMGVVYAAQQDRPRRTVAIKVLRRGFRHPEIVRRFEREAEVLGRLQHQGIAQVFAFHPGDRQAPAHLVMELISGPPITEYVHARALSTADRVALLANVCDAMHHAHERGVIHRDLKPANVLVGDDGWPKILDFGIARATGLDVQSGVHTSHGQIIGTLAFMSPEQLRGAVGDVDRRSDVYALGVLLFRLITGRMPFDIAGLPLVEAVQRILQSDTPRLRAAGAVVDLSLEEITARAMARERDARYESAEAMGNDLRAFVEGRRTRAADVVTAAAAGEQLLAIGLASGDISVIDAGTGKTLATLERGSGPVVTLRFRGDGQIAVEWQDGRSDNLRLPA